MTVSSNVAVALLIAALPASPYIIASAYKARPKRNREIIDAMARNRRPHPITCPALLMRGAAKTA